VIVVSVLEEFFKRIKRSKRSGKNYDWGFGSTGDFCPVDKSVLSSTSLVIRF
jgi:hypothetical protein